MGEIICGHTAQAYSGGSFTCYLPAGHKGWHEEVVRLRGGQTERTNWGDDGLSIHASRDEKRRHPEVAAMRGT